MKTPDPTSLQNLHDIISPNPVSWLPPAPGWYALGLTILLLVSWFSALKYQSWKNNKYRREALIELDEIEKELLNSTSAQQLLPLLPKLIKRTAIAAYGRSAVASLTGDDWLGFLDKTVSTQIFTKGSGLLLNDCSYQPAAQLAEFSSKQVAELQDAVSYWIRKHKNTIQIEI
ncbi:MAG: DUF4381 domain-containing protein [Desulfocapsa sp.]|nr:DUF4381 domain-containing protein [Desulfocapsa sp.]